MSALRRSAVVVVVVVSAVVASSACVNLDGFVWNARQCKVVDPSSDDCKVKHVCTPCDKPYPFDKFGIPAASVTQIPVKVSGGKTIDSYFIAGTGERPDDVVIYNHGNFASIEHYLNRVALLYQMGVSVYAVDYRGFGKSTDDNEPDEPTFMNDMHEVLKSVAAVPALPKRHFVYGYSGGALAGVEMAKTGLPAGTPPCGLILEAPFPSVQSFTDDSTFAAVPESFITNGSWDDIAKMPSVHAPLLQLHGSADDFVRFDVGQQVFNAANDPKQLIKVLGAGHGNGGQDVPTVLGDQYAVDVEAFLDAQNCAVP